MSSGDLFPTMRLRFVVRSEPLLVQEAISRTVHVLQQQWLDANHKPVWRDVPLESEEWGPLESETLE